MLTDLDSNLGSQTVLSNITTKLNGYTQYVNFQRELRIIVLIFVDAFVKVSLCCREKTIKTKKTSTKRNTVDPVFNETLSFNVTSEVMEECELVASVYNYKLKGKDELIGRIVLGRRASGAQEKKHWSSMLVTQRSPVAQWHDLKSKETCEDKCPLASSLVGQ